MHHCPPPNDGRNGRVADPAPPPAPRRRSFSLARLELPDRELLAGLAAAVEPQLPALQPRGLASLLWAFARQGHQPPPKWMDAFLSCCAAELPRFAPREVRRAGGGMGWDVGRKEWMGGGRIGWESWKEEMRGGC